VVAAIPVYLGVRATALAWAGQAVILLVIGLKYRHRLIQLLSLAPLLLSVIWLMRRIPLHTGTQPFTVFVNSAFLSWLGLAALFLVYHVLVRRSQDLSTEQRRIGGQLLYAAGIAVAMIGALLDWTAYEEFCRRQHNPVGDGFFLSGAIMIFTIWATLLIVRPCRPAGPINPSLAVFVSIIGLFLAIIGYGDCHPADSWFVLNRAFFISLAIPSLWAVMIRLWRNRSEEEHPPVWATAAAGFGVLAMVWIIGSLEIHHYFTTAATPAMVMPPICRPRWGCRFFGHCMPGSLWRSVSGEKIIPLRYVRAWTVCHCLGQGFYFRHASFRQRLPGSRIYRAGWDVDRYFFSLSIWSTARIF